jgi:hypothetical protein
LVTTEDRFFYEQQSVQQAPVGSKPLQRSAHHHVREPSGIGPEAAAKPGQLPAS